jgi:hypothetical protein
LCKLSFVASCLCGGMFLEVLGAYERAGLFDFFNLSYVSDDFVEVP